jgi:mannose-6-phosphate isomerase-like protein (cupin superfamily)
MANTIIVSPTSEPVRLGQRANGPVEWRCLSRRGMVFSELEGFEFVRIPTSGTLRGPAHPYTELTFYVIAGEGSAEIGPDSFELAARDLLMLPAAGRYALINGGQVPLELLSVEFVPGAIADRLPYRTPQLVDLPKGRRAA